MTGTRAKPKTFRRRVVSEEWSWGSYNEVTLSCGHILYVHALERYADCKTLSCETCQAKAEMEAEKEAALQAGYSRLAADYDKRPVVPDSGARLPGDIYDL